MRWENRIVRFPPKTFGDMSVRFKFAYSRFAAGRGAAMKRDEDMTGSARGLPLAPALTLT